MKQVVLIAPFILAACGSPEQRLEQRALYTGAAFYHDSVYAAADSAFATAPESERAVFDRGNANFRLGKWSTAIEQFRTASIMDSSTAEQARIHYNIGTSHLTEAYAADAVIRDHRQQLDQMPAAGEDIAQRVAQYVLRDSLQREIRRLDALIDSSLIAATSGFKNTLRKTPGDDDARHNLALAQRFIGQRPKADGSDGKGDGDKDKNKDLTARAMLIMQRADSLVEQYKFQPALDVLQEGLKRDPSLKAKKEYMDKLDVVTKAARTS